MAFSSTPDPPVQHFYRRPLPDMCISFSSAEGKVIFREALEQGFMESYFPLASQFRTQEEPAFCGLSTLVMVLNTLEVDPQKIWKAPWRWYHEDMLDCCVSLSVVKQNGITFDQFICLAACNTLNVKAVRACKNVSAEHFREQVKRVSQGSDDVIVVCYARQGLDQTGTGHFSPIAGYHPERDLVLIMDVARFKYPPHWVKVDTLFNAMQYIDMDTGLPRGFLILSKSVTVATILFRLTSHLCVTGVLSNRLVQFITEWKSWLNNTTDLSSSSETLDVAISHLLKLLDKTETNLLISLVDTVAMENISTEHQNAVQQLIMELENLTMFQVVKNSISERDEVDLEAHETEAAELEKKDSTKQVILTNEHYITMLMLIWPYKGSPGGSFGSKLEELVGCQLEDTVSQLLQNEVCLLRQQMEHVAVCNNCTCQVKTLLSLSE